jgi:hypothetical protein
VLYEDIMQSGGEIAALGISCGQLVPSTREKQSRRIDVDSRTRLPGSDGTQFLPSGMPRTLDPQAATILCLQQCPVHSSIIR